MKKKVNSKCNIVDIRCILILVLGLFVIILVFLLFLNYLKINKQLEELNRRHGGGFVELEENADLVEKAGRHILLPADITPEVTEIVDITKLKSEQPFFENAQNGDYLIIYPNKAIIYDPDEDIIINVGPVYNSTIEPVRIEVRNGTLNEGVAEILGEQLEAEPEIEVSAVNEAANTSYEKTVIVNLGEKNISGLEQLFGVQAVNELPEGEVASDSEVVIIVGDDVKYVEDEEVGDMEESAGAAAEAEDGYTEEDGETVSVETEAEGEDSVSATGGSTAAMVQVN